MQIHRTCHRIRDRWYQQIPRPWQAGRIHWTGPINEKLCRDNAPWNDNPCRQQDSAMSSHIGSTCTHDACKRHDNPNGVLQTCRKKARNLQGHRCNGCQDAAHDVLDAKKLSPLQCQIQRTESRRNAEAKHLNNVNAKKSVKNKKSAKGGKKLAKKWITYDWMSGDYG